MRTSAPAGRARISATRDRLAVADLEGDEAGLGRAREPLVRSRSEQCDLGLPAQLRLEAVEARDVRRVGDDEIPALAGRLLPVLLAQLDVEPEPLGVLARERERVGGDVDADDDRARAVRP
jgi:hypothetical protein